MKKVGFKIREHTLQRVPYLLVAGDREAGSNSLAVRTLQWQRSRGHARRGVGREACRGSREPRPDCFGGITHRCSYRKTRPSQRRDHFAPVAGDRRCRRADRVSSAASTRWRWPRPPSSIWLRYHRRRSRRYAASWTLANTCSNRTRKPAAKRKQKQIQIKEVKFRSGTEGRRLPGQAA